MVIVKDKDGNIIEVSKNDSRYKNGELLHLTTGMVTVKDKDGNTMQVSKDDTRYISGELVGIRHGTICVYDINTKKQHTVEFQNFDDTKFFRIKKNTKMCKDTNNNIIYLYKDSIKIKKNDVMVANLATNGKDKFLVFSDDIRIISGELEFIKRKKYEKKVDKQNEVLY